MCIYGHLFVAGNVNLERCGITLLCSYVDPCANHVISSKDQNKFIPSEFSAPEGLGAVPAHQGLFAVNFVLRFPSGQTLTLSAIHRLLIKFLSNEEVDLCGADCGGSLDVEVLSVLSDLHMWL